MRLQSITAVVQQTSRRFVVEPLACPLVIEVRSIIQSQQFGASLTGGGVGGGQVNEMWRTGKAHV